MAMIPVLRVHEKLDLLPPSCRSAGPATCTKPDPRDAIPFAVQWATRQLDMVRCSDASAAFHRLSLGSHCARFRAFRCWRSKKWLGCGASSTISCFLVLYLSSSV